MFAYNRFYVDGCTCKRVPELRTNRFVWSGLSFIQMSTVTYVEATWYPHISFLLCFHSTNYMKVYTFAMKIKYKVSSSRSYDVTLKVNFDYLS